MKVNKIEREFATLKNFVEVYCRHHHPRETLCAERGVCPDCCGLLDYARARLERCPFDPKPKCKDCTVHCYRKDYRQRVREVMRYSGMYYVKRGRIDWLIKYFL